MAGCATRHHTWAVNPPVSGTRCVGRKNGQPCDAIYLGAPASSRPAPAGEGDTPAAPSPAGDSLGKPPAPAPRATLGAALSAARGAQAPGAPAPLAPTAPALPPAPEPNSWQKLASRKLLSALFALNDKAMELRKREPLDDPPDEDDPEFMEAATELSKSLAIWFPATALPPWGNAAIITAGMLSERWIMSKPVVDVEAKPVSRAPAAAGATAAATKPAAPPPETPPAVPVVETSVEIG